MNSPQRRLNWLRALLTSGYLTLAGGAANLYELDRPPLPLGQSVGAIGWADEEILVAGARGGVRYDRRGARIGTVDSRPGATAVARVAGHLAVGYRGGMIEVDPPLDLDALPPSPVVALAEGPARTLVAGFARGQIGVWDLEHGVRLFESKLNGAATELVVVGSALHALSELGDARAIELGVLTRDPQALLREVRREIPVVWEAGRPVRRTAAE